MLLKQSAQKNHTNVFYVELVKFRVYSLKGLLSFLLLQNYYAAWLIRPPVVLPTYYFEPGPSGSPAIFGIDADPSKLRKLKKVIHV